RRVRRRLSLPRSRVPLRRRLRARRRLKRLVLGPHDRPARGCRRVADVERLLAGARRRRDPAADHRRARPRGGRRLMAELRYRDALNAALREELRRDERVVLMGEDIGVFGGAFKVTAGLLDEFGEKRVRDTPISENTIVGAGVGAAMAGLRPVVELMTI